VFFLVAGFGTIRMSERKTGRILEWICKEKPVAVRTIAMSVVLPEFFLIAYPATLSLKFHGL